MRRLASYAWIVSILILLAGFAWLTRHPDAGILDRAREWPLVGPLAVKFRRTYLPPVPAARPPLASESESGPAEPRQGPDESPVPETLGATPHVWVQPGTRVHEHSDLESAVVATLGSLSNLSLVEQRGDWYRIRKLREGEPTIRGWVYLEDYQEPRPEVLRRPEPVLPLAAAAPAPERIAAARALMKNGGSGERCGPHPLFTDAGEPELLALCARLVASLERVYRQRYGVQPVSAPSEAILLFQRPQDYQAFRDLEGVPYESNQAHASPARGYIALYRGDRRLGPMLSTLVHELTHLLNRRALGPALPAWLGEGMADDLAESRIDADGSIHPGELGGERLLDGATVVRTGGIASALAVQDALDRGQAPTLAELIRLDPETFHAGDRSQLHYALASLWVRYLVSGFDPALAAGFREFLSEIASGRRLTEDRLRAKLGRSWPELDSGFRTWVRLQYLPASGEKSADRLPSNAAQER